MNQMFVYERVGLTSDGSVIGRHTQRTKTALGGKFKAAGLYNGAASGEVG